MYLIGVGGTRYISFEDRHWHNDCFVCQRCRTSLVGRGFLTEGPDILCPDCGKRDHYYEKENNGYTTGHTTGYTTGSNVGYTTGSNVGYTTGSNVGYTTGPTVGHRTVVSYHHRTN